MDFMFSKEQIRQAIKAYGKTAPNCWYAMKYKGDNQWEIYRGGKYTPESPYKPPYIYDYDAYFITDKTGKPLDIMISGTKDSFRERLINAYYTSQHDKHNALCITYRTIINNVTDFSFRTGYCSIRQQGGASVLIDYRTKGQIFWL